MGLYTLVASTISSRTSGRAANQLPMISSERPRPASPPYTFAVSMKLMPICRALSKIWWDSSSEALGPKCMVPRQILLTPMLERPRLLWSI